MQGENVSPQELQGKYTVAMRRIGAEAGSGGAERHRPIYQRNEKLTEQNAIEEAANALSALWKVRRSDRT